MGLDGEVEVGQALDAGGARTVDHAQALGLLGRHRCGVGLVLGSTRNPGFDQALDVVALPRRQGQDLVDQAGLVLDLGQGGGVGQGQLAVVHLSLGRLGQLQQGHVGTHMLGAAPDLGRQLADGATERHQAQVPGAELGGGKRVAVVILRQHGLDLFGLAEGLDDTRRTGQSGGAGRAQSTLSGDEQECALVAGNDDQGHDDADLADRLGQGLDVADVAAKVGRVGLQLVQRDLRQGRVRGCLGAGCVGGAHQLLLSWPCLARMRCVMAGQPGPQGRTANRSPS